MAHQVTALVGAADFLRKALGEQWASRLVMLDRRLALFPLPDGEDEDAPDTPFPLVGTDDGPGFRFLTPSVLDKLMSYSVGGALVYFETEYFGGIGDQGSVSLVDGRVAYGPRWSADIGPINEALRVLGVSVKSGSFDEFDTLGLGRYRFTSDWLDQASAS